MSEFIIKDAGFGKICDLPLLFETIKEFIEDYIYIQPNNGILLSELSNLYVLVARIDSHKYQQKGEKCWKDI